MLSAVQGSSENYTKSINTICGQIEQLLNVEAEGRYSLVFLSNKLGLIYYVMLCN
jgi:hypothetical protein